MEFDETPRFWYPRVAFAVWINFAFIPDENLQSDFHRSEKEVKRRKIKNKNISLMRSLSPNQIPSSFFNFVFISFFNYYYYYFVYMVHIALFGFVSMTSQNRGVPLTTRQRAEYSLMSGNPTPLTKIRQNLLCTRNSTQIQNLSQTVHNDHTGSTCE